MPHLGESRLPIAQTLYTVEIAIRDSRTSNCLVSLNFAFKFNVNSYYSIENYYGELVELVNPLYMCR